MENFVDILIRSVTAVIVTIITLVITGVWKQNKKINNSASKDDVKEAKNAAIEHANVKCDEVKKYTDQRVESMMMIQTPQLEQIQKDLDLIKSILMHKSK